MQQTDKIKQEIINKLSYDLKIYKEINGELPEFWQSRYVMGYFYGQIGTLTQILDVEEELSSNDRARLVFEVLNSIAWQPAHLIFEACGRLLNAHDPDFAEGFENGYLVVMCERGGLALDPKAHPALREAIAIAENVYQKPKRPEVLMALRQLVFTKKAPTAPEPSYRR